MRTHGSVTRIGAGGIGLLALGALAVSFMIGLGASPAAGAKAARPDAVALGKEIFHREWLPGDRRGHGGDGLGPVYNDTSCIACHNSGGAGGGGPNSKNIEILSATPWPRKGRSIRW
jgi:mono/diheme cytochrome c family protein